MPKWELLAFTMGLFFVIFPLLWWSKKAVWLSAERCFLLLKLIFKKQTIERRLYAYRKIY
jgi:hypothetical protein